DSPPHVTRTRPPRADRRPCRRSRAAAVRAGRQPHRFPCSPASECPAEARPAAVARRVPLLARPSPPRPRSPRPDARTAVAEGANARALRRQRSKRAWQLQGDPGSLREILPRQPRGSAIVTRKPLRDIAQPMTARPFQREAPWEPRTVVAHLNA